VLKNTDTRIFLSGETVDDTVFKVKEGGEVKFQNKHKVSLCTPWRHMEGETYSSTSSATPEREEGE
jgi:hypothetical protein